MKDTISQGEKSEQIFATECFVGRGYMVSLPNGTADYDLIVDVNGSLKKVQVKSTSRDNGNVMICKGSNGQGNKGRGKYPYPKGSIDFFALHDVKKDKWYIVPRSATGDAKQLRIAQKREGKYSVWENNWEFSEIPKMSNTLF
tara:strand:+ start:72 stop:500 length:429 start_codon:yes stop_codon:yes gene_type:complete